MLRTCYASPIPSFGRWGHRITNPHPPLLHDQLLVYRVRIHSLHAGNGLQRTHLSSRCVSFSRISTFPPMLALPYETTMAGKPPTYLGSSGPIPMQPFTCNGENHARFDPTTNSER